MWFNAFKLFLQFTHWKATLKYLFVRYRPKYWKEYAKIGLNAWTICQLSHWIAKTRRANKIVKHSYSFTWLLQELCLINRWALYFTPYDSFHRLAWNLWLSPLTEFFKMNINVITSFSLDLVWFHLDHNSGINRAFFFREKVH